MYLLLKPAKHFVLFIAFIACTTVPLPAQTVKRAERICGKWENTEKSLIIQVYVEHSEFKAKILWYADTEGKPIDYWTDRHNPNPALRSRKILGLQILRKLEYHPKTNTWENGIVYDSRHGKEWSSSAYIDKNGLMRVRGYWHFKFIGKTMTFFRVK
jgi:uncharacterized protein (DUF2147 family)